ncbi:MAG: arylsulfatase [Planctomycetaceae bacterium]|nr:arylsulfatase [Planctomycetaceae bacterium]
MSRSFFGSLLFVVGALGTMGHQTVQGTDRPNIIVILSDDMGFSDIQPYGGEIATPTLQRLADQGLCFTQFYNTARCCPTRASLLTGLYPHQAGVGWMMTDRGHDGYRGDLNRNCQTIAEVLGTAGYGTYAVGKWHVTPYVRPGEPKHNWPLQRGFDRFYGTIHGAGSFYDPNSLTRDNELISPFVDREYQPETYYYTDAISDHAVRFIEEHLEQAGDREQPFFLYVAYTAAHWPMHALPDDIAKYDGHYDAGYGAIRQQRLRRVRELGLVPPDCELTPQAEDWDAVPHQDWELRCMEVYAAMVDRMDQGIGKIVNCLDEAGQFENTLIFFLQDNGGCAEGLGRNPNGGLKERAANATLAPMRAEELQLDMIPKQSRDGFPVIQGPGVMPGAADTYIAYGRGWANVSNTPFREYKHWVHEGGISTPLIAHWPEGLKRSGEWEHQPGHLVDIMATCVDVAGAKYPDHVDGQPIKPLEGKSLVPAFGGQTIEREAIYWEHEGNRAIRVRNWKLVAKENQPWELYDISQDRSEMHDLSSQNPHKVQDLAEMWDRWAARANVLPLGGWRGNGNKNGQFSSNKSFQLKPGDHLVREQAPYVIDHSFQVTIEIAEPGKNGILMAHGGSAYGYALHFENGELVYSLRNGGQLWTLRSNKSVSDAKSLTLKVSKGGKTSLFADGKPCGSDKPPQGLSQMPADGLQIGGDDKGLVGDYQADFNYSGKIESVSILIGRTSRSE